jgi:hypothetical protein
MAICRLKSQRNWLRKLIEEEKMVGGVKSLYYLFREMLY